jgi:hypothetical protein
MPTKEKKPARPGIPGYITRMADEIKRDAVPWSPSLPYAKVLKLQSKTWQAWADATVPEAAQLKPHVGATGKFDKIEIGNWILHRTRLPQIHYVTELQWFTVKSFWKVESLSLYRSGRPYGHVYFDGDVVIPVLADAQLKPWMSPTPAEVLSQRPGVRKACGDVLVAGLGMGWMAKEVARKKGVRSVTVVERDQDVASFFGAGFKVADGRVKRTVIVDDFYAMNFQGFDSVIADIWPGANDAGYDQRFQKIKRDLTAAGVKVWGWGDYVSRD